MVTYHKRLMKTKDGRTRYYYVKLVNGVKTRVPKLEFDEQRKVKREPMVGGEVFTNDDTQAQYVVRPKAFPSFKFEILKYNNTSGYVPIYYTRVDGYGMPISRNSSGEFNSKIEAIKYLNDKLNAH